MNDSEIIAKLNSIDNSIYLKEYNAYAVKVDDMIGIAIPVDKPVEIDEHFNKVYIKNFLFEIANEQKNVVFLFTKESQMSEKYGTLCLNFLSEKSRDIILNNPIKWFYEWRDLLGDSTKNKLIYDFIGEMAVLNILQERGYNPVWESITKGTFDITSNEAVYEVKTSKSKTVETVTIHNQFQLDTKGINKPLFIAYVKVEANESGESIDSLAKKLIKNGYDKVSLNEYLKENGYYEHKNERYKKFVIHEIRLYKVDESFPFITKDSFIENKIPNNVISFEYTISLDGLKYTIF